MQNWVPIFRLATIMSPFASTFFFFFNLLQWSFWEERWGYSMNSTHPIGQIHPHSKAKTKQKRAGKTKSREKRGKTKRHRHARPCASHHGPWWALPDPVPIFLERRILSYFGPRDVPWISPALGLLGLLCYSLHLAWFQIMLFSNKLGPNYAILQ